MTQADYACYVMGEFIMKNNNILIIICDQLSATALRTYGNTYSATPNLDRLSQTSAVMEYAYTPCPLCQPARTSLWTSRYPHQTGVLSNLPDQGFPAVSEMIPTLGELFSAAGYHCVHFGKTHDYGGLRGFDIIESEEIRIPRTNPAIKFDYETYLDIDTTKKSIGYLSSQPKQPFLMVSDLQNPHNICAYIGEHSEGGGEFPLDRELPPLPENFEFDDIANRPEFIQYLCCAHRRQRQTTGWTKDDFRHYLYAYYYYLSMVDRQIGEILGTLEQSGMANQTMVVFLADHGEGMAAHRLVTKYGAFYEESNRVPFLFSLPESSGQTRITGVTSLLDLVPTLLDYAEITAPSGLEGISLMPQITGKASASHRFCAVGEWYDEFRDYTVPGRMICDEAYKYTCYLEPDSEELYDMKNDRLERINLARKPEYCHILKQYRELLQNHLEKSEDPFRSLKTAGTEHYRHHPLGFEHHQGLSAVEQYAQQIKRKQMV